MQHSFHLLPCHIVKRRDDEWLRVEWGARKVVKHPFGGVWHYLSCLVWDHSISKVASLFSWKLFSRRFNGIISSCGINFWIFITIISLSYKIHLVDWVSMALFESLFPQSDINMSKFFKVLTVRDHIQMNDFPLNIINRG